MRAGKLRHRLQIQSRVAGSPQRSATGAAATTFSELCTVWGSLEPLSGKRLESAQATWPQAVVEVRIRYRAEVLAADTEATPLRVVFGGRYYPVGKVLNIEERNRELRLLCTQGAASG